METGVEQLDVSEKVLDLGDREIPHEGLYIRLLDPAGEYWHPVVRELWSSYTGRRAVWGIEYHGPVFVEGQTTPWRGRRVCGCQTCQADVEASQRAS